MRSPGRYSALTGEFGISDSAWAMHLLGLQRALPASRYQSLTECLPMMRAVKDDNELMRLAAAGAAADSTYGEIVQRRFAGRRETEVAADLADLKAPKSRAPAAWRTSYRRTQICSARMRSSSVTPATQPLATRRRR